MLTPQQRKDQTLADGDAVSESVITFNRVPKAVAEVQDLALAGFFERVAFDDFVFGFDCIGQKVPKSCRDPF